MAAVRAFAGGSPRHAVWLIDSTAWRWQIADAAAARRQRTSSPRDLDLLDRPCFVPLAWGFVLSYPESDMLVMPAQAPGVLRRLEGHERTLKGCRPLQMAEEFAIVATLRYDLRRLLHLNSQHALRRAGITPNPQYDDSRADQARPSRSPLNP